MRIEDQIEFHRLPGEEWRESPSNPTHYVSNLGRCMRVPHQVSTYRGALLWYGGTPTYGAGKGRKTIQFKVNGRSKNLRVSILVCEAFNGPKPFPEAVVMHDDENNTNNRSENLKWGTQKQNLNYPGFIDYCRSRTGDNNPYIKGMKSDKS